MGEVDFLPAQRAWTARFTRLMLLLINGNIEMPLLGAGDASSEAAEFGLKEMHYETNKTFRDKCSE